jgi:hypothetical protein
MDAYEVMHEWDRASGTDPRSSDQLDVEVPALLSGADYEDWKRKIEAKDIASITLGMRVWGLPIGHLGQFEIDDAIETAERPD